ncbi:large conductance mechanosensitive channel protein MscL [Actinoplanes sp. NBRC 103695]|uniref:large conductance mechanosensitive channel protein MscL n=1 Tax=Actinoplanes sp. NBRC 103695 TaxID=3032202 RepID=UPI0024A5DFA9|nr:large conductance mechanosensitive channel protein MscL [Actinoplanes sp. NBRC 103695]GLZ00057.1 large-conductance mechanosensitive channel [Actinoplanes sp. NBRC 103695]
MLKGFKDFIMRGNVVDLAVGIVIGAAFTTVVTAFTNGFLKPLIQLIGGGTGVGAGAWKARDGVFFDYATFLNALITFVLTAAVLYFLVVFPLNKLAERRARGEEPPPAAPSEDIVLLTQIRDALVANRAGPGAVSDVNAHTARDQEPPQHR